MSAAARGRSNRQRGAAKERELFGLLSEALGVPIKRELRQSRDGGADGEGLPGWAIECKYVASLSRPAWWRQVLRAAADSGRQPVLFYRVARPRGAPLSDAWRAIVPAQLSPVGGEAVRGLRDAVLVDFPAAVRVLQVTTTAGHQHHGVAPHQDHATKQEAT